MKRLFALLAVLVLSLSLPVNVEAESNVVKLGEYFSVTNQNGCTLSGIITTEDQLVVKEKENILNNYNIDFDGTFSIVSSDGTAKSTPYKGRFMGIAKERKFGLINVDVDAFASARIDGTVYSESFNIVCEIEIINSATYGKPESPDTEIVVDQPTTFTANNSSTSVLPYFYITELKYETEEVDEEDNIIERSYTDDILDWVTQNVHLYNADSTELPIRDIWFSKNITNLKYGEKNAYIYIDTADEYYKSSKIKVTVNYEPELEIDDVTRTKIVAVPINGAEYSINGTTWQKSNKFTKLTKNTEYTVYFRQKGDTTGESIRSVEVTTEAD